MNTLTLHFEARAAQSRHYDVWFRPIFAFFIVDVNSKRVVHVGVTRAPIEDWTAQQLREVTPFGKGPQVLIRDGDTKCTALRAPSLRSGPWLSVYCRAHKNRSRVEPAKKSGSFTRWQFTSR